MTKKLTPWFPPEVKPARKGVYIGSIFRDDGLYRYWDGVAWSFPEESPQEAYRYRKDGKRGHSEISEDVEWRGLARRPR
jgi:hypothetical protein